MKADWIDYAAAGVDGMTWKEYSALSKSVFVETATEEYGIKGRPTNISRVSILTGIDRKEVKRQRDLLQSDMPVLKRKTTDATRVLSGWHQDADFIGKKAVVLAWFPKAFTGG